MNHNCPGLHKASEGIGKSCLWSCCVRLCFFYLNGISTHVCLGGDLSLLHELMYSSLKIIAEYLNVNENHCYQNASAKRHIMRRHFSAVSTDKFQDAVYKTEDILILRVRSFPVPEVSSLEWWVNGLHSGTNFWLCLFFTNQASKDTGTELK